MIWIKEDTVYQTSSRIAGSCVACLLVLALAGCQGDPEQQVAKARADYNAELLAFAVQRTEVDEPPIAPPEEESAPVEVENDEVEPAELEPPQKDIILDILIHWRGFDRLPGITLDITHVDAAEREKGLYHLWVDTSRLERGPGDQITHVLEGVPYGEGDGFHVGVRRHVPEEERHLYREFSEAR